MKNLVFLIAILGCVGLGRAQNFNVDIDTAPPQTGGGVPTDQFGGATNQPGRWNSVFTIGHADWLYGLDGVPTSVSLSIASSNQSLSGGGFANPANTGDYARLLNDARYIDDLWASWTFHGLVNGQYRVVTYAVRPFPIESEARVSVNGGPVAFAFGPMPGNQFVPGVTHVIQDTFVSNGTLEILVARNPNGEIAACNGFQITAVPEPATAVLVLSGLAAFRIRNRKSS